MNYEIWTYIREDIKMFRLVQSRPGLLKYIYHPDFRVVITFRLSQLFFKFRLLRPLSYCLTVLNDVFNGVWIGPRVQAGPGLFMGHPRGLVVNPTAVLGSHCYLLQRVTIGGTGVVIGDNVEINANVTIVSNDRAAAPGLRIGSNVVIGAGAVVVRDVADCVVVAGVPAKVVKRISSQENWVQWRMSRLSTEHG